MKRFLVDEVVWIDSVEDPDLCGFTIPGWYFWDETQSQCHGPFDTWLKAYDSVLVYAERIS